MKSTIGFVGTLVLMYLTGAFVNVDFDPVSWGVGGRAFIAFLALSLGAGIAMALYDE